MKISSIISRIKALFISSNNNDSSNDDYNAKDLHRKFESLKFWKPELIEWIGNTNDPVKLAVASCLVNSHEWPKWLPGRPKNYNGKLESIELYYVVEVHKMLQEKSERIAPKLHSYIWLTHFYRNYKIPLETK